MIDKETSIEAGSNIPAVAQLNTTEILTRITEYESSFASSLGKVQESIEKSQAQLNQLTSMRIQLMAQQSMIQSLKQEITNPVRKEAD